MTLGTDQGLPERCRQVETVSFNAIMLSNMPELGEHRTPLRRHFGAVIQFSLQRGPDSDRI